MKNFIIIIFTILIFSFANAKAEKNDRYNCSIGKNTEGEDAFVDFIFKDKEVVKIADGLIRGSKIETIFKINKEKGEKIYWNMGKKSDFGSSTNIFDKKSQKWEQTYVNPKEWGVETAPCKKVN